MVRNLYVGILSKTLLSVTGLLLLIFGGLVALNYANIRHFFEIERSEAIHHQQALFNEHYVDVGRQLQLLTNISASHHTNLLQDHQQVPSIIQAIEHDAPLPLTELIALTPSNQMIWPTAHNDHEQMIANWFIKNNKNAHNNWVLDCYSQCNVYFYTQFDYQGKSYPFIYGIDAATLYRSYSGSNHRGHLLMEIQADHHVALLYSSQRINAHIGELINQTTEHELLSGLRDFVSAGQATELVSFQISNTTAQLPIFFVQFNTINGLIAHFRQANRNNVIYGICSLVLAILLLIALLRHPLVRVRQLTYCLPMLASSSFRQFRQVIVASRSSWLIDESDKLGEEAVTLSYQLEHLENQLQNRAAELEWLAGHDHLTQLSNRRDFEQLLQKRIRSQTAGCLMMMDLDNFRYVNDLSGHHCGDQMLLQIGQLLQRMLPENAILARFSGDQFAAYIDDLTPLLAKRFVERINYRLGELKVAGREAIHTASMSIGVVIFPEHDTTYAGLISKADMCLYQAKSQGKHCGVIYEREHQSGDLIQRHFWLDLAQHAIERQQTVLYFQPIMDNRIDQIRHYEVLLRIKDDNGQMISPYELIIAAENNGYIFDIDLWVVRSALSRLEENLEFNCRDRLAINLSARSFGTSSVIAQIVAEIEHRAIPGELIIFEITETAALPDFAKAQEHIEKLKSMGCAIALDDFGVGYSSFHSLRELALDYVKIDGSFVHDILDNHKNRYFVRSLCRIAHDLGLLTIAEYVENEQLNQELCRIGVDFSQGYFIGKPMPAEQIWAHQNSSQVLSLRQ
ncbi:putative bifunctional diguanylate cyclase/phosphodiesterase [Celerinatantimonas sp. MCCC 1A17872]|uniref:putative bifunctional diguanylate cyclase/phosphodiesterase n=1 Tax=Celerinatantimonas sp. MCCC 1A17872 TaxID=3177514 RepID=UPI0038C962B2